MKETIQIDEEIAGLVLPQETKFKNNRAQITVEGDKVHITARDQSAFKAARSSIQKIIKIHKKTKALVKNG